MPISIQDAEIASDVETIVGSNASFFCLLAEFKTQDVNKNKEACQSLILKKMNISFLRLGKNNGKWSLTRIKKTNKHEKLFRQTVQSEDIIILKNEMRN